MWFVIAVCYCQSEMDCDYAIYLAVQEKIACPLDNRLEIVVNDQYSLKLNIFDWGLFYERPMIKYKQHEMNCLDTDLYFVCCEIVNHDFRICKDL